LYTCVNNLEFLKQSSNNGTLNNEVKELTVKYKNAFCEAMDDDLNTGLAIAALFDLVRDINSRFTSTSVQSIEDIDECINMLKELGGVLGILQNTEEDSIDNEIEELIAKRQEARKNKNFALADEIRDNLKAQGIVLEDTPNGVKWKRV